MKVNKKQIGLIIGLVCIVVCIVLCMTMCQGGAQEETEPTVESTPPASETVVYSYDTTPTEESTADNSVVGICT